MIASYPECDDEWKAGCCGLSRGSNIYTPAHCFSKLIRTNTIDNEPTPRYSRRDSKHQSEDIS